MNMKLRFGAVLIPLLAAVVGHAECAVSSDPSATVRPLNDAIQADADAIISMSLLPKLMHIDYATAAKKPACDLGQVISGDRAYDLWGDDAAGRQRKGLPAKKGDPIALVLPVTDILKALD